MLIGKAVRLNPGILILGRWNQEIEIVNEAQYSVDIM